MLAGEQDVQQDAERVDVGGGRDLAAGQLLGAANSGVSAVAPSRVSALVRV
jgi:hypothetical protein